MLDDCFIYNIILIINTTGCPLTNKKIVTSRCDNPEERSSQLLHGGTLKFLLARRHKYHTPTFLVCTTHWRITNNFLLLELTTWRPFRAHKSELMTTRAPQLLLILLLVPKLLLHGIPITATAQDLHHAQYLQPHKIRYGPNDSPPPKKKSSILVLPHIAILVPHDELVMKSYVHVRLAIVETHYHNLNINVKNQDYWLLT